MLTPGCPCLTEGHTELSMPSISDSQLIVNGKGLIRLLEYEAYETQWRDRLEELGVSIDWGYGSPDLINVLLDLLDFPEDSEDEDGFCRDYLRMGPEGFHRSAMKPQEYLDWLFEQKRELLEG